MENTDNKNNSKRSKKTMFTILKKSKEYMRLLIFVMPAIVVAVFAMGGLYIGENIAANNRQTEYSSAKSADNEKGTLSDNNSNTDKAKDEVSDKKENVKVAKAKVNTVKAKSGKPADGVFSGNSICEKFGYTVSLKVKFKNGASIAVYDMKMLNNQDSANVSFMNKAWRGMVSRIVGNKTSDIDIVSGATYSSKAVLNAYLDAYDKAVAKQNGEKVKETPMPVPAPSPSKRPVPVSVKNDKKNKITEGTIVDGNYKVSEVCEPDEDEDFEKYTMTAVFTFKNGKCIKISGITSNSESNKAYYMKAANGTTSDRGVVAQIVGKKVSDDMNVNAVSGATCSSKTIYRLYVKAVEKATKKKRIAPQESKKPQYTSKPQESKKPSATESSMPSPAPSNEPEVNAKPTAAPVLIPLNDGVYSETVTVYPDENNEFEEYTIFADVVFEENRLKGIENTVLSDETNRFYYNKALNGTKIKPGLLAQIEAKQEGEYDVVSGATCSSKALQQLYLKALEEAKIK